MTKRRLRIKLSSVPAIFGIVRSGAVVPDEDDDLRLRDGANVAVIAHVNGSDVTLGEEDWLALDRSAKMVGVNLRGDLHDEPLQTNVPQLESVVIMAQIVRRQIISAELSGLREGTGVVVVGRDEDIWVELSDLDLISLLERVRGT